MFWVPPYDVSFYAYKTCVIQKNDKTHFWCYLHIYIYLPIIGTIDNLKKKPQAPIFNIWLFSLHITAHRY